jgi:erythronate-4-phosphate dehydrogenase
MTINIVADQNMPLLEELLSPWANLRKVDGRQLRSSDLREADALLVRSVTKVNSELLSEAESLRFVGSATIGTDHIDRDLLSERCIAFAHAPGCNAASVADYVSSALALLYDDLPLRLDQGRTASVIGFGQTGSRAAQRLRALGFRVQVFDPFVERLPQPYMKVPFEKALQCDVLTIHTPLTRQGRHPTWHLFDADALAAMPESACIINAARGPVIDNKALLHLKQQRPEWRLVLDVWEHEPAVDTALAELCDIVTPHIAGYALQGKQRGSWMVVNALRKSSGMEGLPPFAAPPQRTLDFKDTLPLAEILLQAYDIRMDDRRMRRMLRESSNREQGFDQLRKRYPERHEYASIRVSRDLLKQQPLLASLGFSAGD